jgi:hypothetical protein
MKIVPGTSVSPALAAIVLSLLTIATLTFTSGCNNTGKASPTPANFTLGINNHYLDHPACLLTDTRFPFETSDPVITKQMDTLVKNLLLEKSVETSIHVSRYTVTPAGTRYAPRFCYGHREVTGINSFTPIAVNNGFKETTVTYTYTMKEVPVWAESHDIQAAFPAMAHATTSQATDTIVLAQSPVGWQVPD